MEERKGRMGWGGRGVGEMVYPEEASPRRGHLNKGREGESCVQIWRKACQAEGIPVHMS